MPRRKAGLALVLALPLLVLTACTPIVPPPAATPSASGIAAPAASATPTPTPTPTPTAAALPADTVLQVTATATASNGAVMNLTATVLRPRLYSDPISAPRVARTKQWCQDDEVDQGLFQSQHWSFGEVDYTATLAPGSAAWPTSLWMLLAPWTPDGPVRAATGDVKSIEYTGNGPGDYEPYCVQRVFLKGPGSGAVYLGAADGAKNPPFEDWSKIGYGFDFNLPKKVVPAGSVTVTNCASNITPLGNSFGAPNSSWATTSSAVQCVVGDPETQNKPHT